MSIVIDQNHLDLVHRAKSAAGEAAFAAALRETADLGVATAARDGARFAVRDFMLGRPDRIEDDGEMPGLGDYTGELHLEPWERRYLDWLISVGPHRFATSLLGGGSLVDIGAKLRGSRPSEAESERRFREAIERRLDG